MRCDRCGSTEFIVRGRRKRKKKETTQYQCKGCGTYRTVNEARTSAKILLLDIETLPGEAYFFDPRTEYITSDKVIKDWSICCWGAKWLFEPEIFGEVVSPKEAISRQDASILGGMWNLVDQAQIIVTQNGIQFDMKKLNSRFIMAGFPPPSHYLNVDTKVIAKTNFGFTYNSLDWLGKELLGLDGKEKMVFDDWVECAKGKQDALDKMFHYCKNDVAPLLEDLYLKLRPWGNHPNMNIFTNHDRDVCPKCESEKLQWGLTYKTPQGLWMGFRCGDCGAIGRGTRKAHNIKNVGIK